MLTLNGKKLARNDAEFSASLFESGGTCVGFYKPLKCSIEIQDASKRKVGVINRYGVMGAATPLPDGKWWYSYADVPNIGRYESTMRRTDECRAAIETHCPGAYRTDNRPARF